MDELAGLAAAAGATVVGRVIQQLPSPSPSHYVGKGKLEELIALRDTADYSVIIVDDALSPLQQHNLEETLQNYSVLRGGTMREQEDQSPKEAKRAEKRAAQETRRLAKDEAKKKADSAREQAIEKSSQAKEIKRAEERVAEEIEQLTKDKARKEAYLAREQAIAEAQEKRLKGKKEPPK